MKSQGSSRRWPVARAPCEEGRVSRPGLARARPAVDQCESRRPRAGANRTPSANTAACVDDLRIFAIIGDEVVEVLWDRFVDDPMNILVRRLDGSEFAHPIHCFDEVQLMR